MLHTPGPWCVQSCTGEHLHDICLANPPPGAGHPVAIAFVHCDEAPRHARDAAYISAVEAEANARLMAAAPELLGELLKAHAIITAMLNAMTDEAKARVADELARLGISPDGMTRFHERVAVIAKTGMRNAQEWALLAGRAST